MLNEYDVILKNGVQINLEAEKITRIVDVGEETAESIRFTVGREIIAEFLMDNIAGWICEGVVTNGKRQKENSPIYL